MKNKERLVLAHRIREYLLEHKRDSSNPIREDKLGLELNATLAEIRAAVRANPTIDQAGSMIWLKPKSRQPDAWA